MSGGSLTVFGPQGARGDGALDANGAFAVTGGTLVTVGGAGVAQASGDSSTQPWLSATASGSAGDLIELVDDAGETVLSLTAEVSFSTIVISSPDLVPDAEYTVMVAGESVTTVTEGTATIGQGGPGGQPGGGAGGPGGGGQRP